MPDALTRPSDTSAHATNGYYWTGEQCENFNECSLPSVYCIGGQCIDTEGSYTCVCPEGKIEGANGRYKQHRQAEPTVVAMAAAPGVVETPAPSVPLSFPSPTRICAGCQRRLW